MLRSITCAALLACLFLVGANKPEKPHVLAGLKSFYVEVVPFCQAAVDAGLDVDRLKTHVELTLRKAGIRVINQAEWIKTDLPPSLRVDVTIMPPKRGEKIWDGKKWVPSEEYEKTVLFVDIGLSEDGFIPRLNRTTSVMTWHTGAVISANIGSTEALFAAVDPYVDEFMNEYFAANPKGQP